jgi:hypothetical protein
MADFTQDDVNNWFAANPNATQQDVANTVQSLGGLDANPGLADMIGQHYGATGADVGTVYNQLTAPAAPAAVYEPANAWTNNVPPPVAYGTTNQTVNSGVGTVAPVTPTPSPFDQMATAYQGGDYSGVNSLLAKNNYTPAQIQQQYGLSDAQMDDIRTHGVNLGYTNPQVQSYVSGVLGDNTLTPWEQTNKILETAQRAGVGMDQLQNIYGANTVNKALGDYKSGIQNYLTDTLAKEPGTTMNEVGAIHQAAQKYGIDAADLAKYGGIDQKTAQSYFDMYNKGLGNIVSNLADSKTDDLTKTQTALALQQKFGTTDAELAKASNGKYTEADIKAYLDPVRNVPTNLQQLMNDPNATAADITKFINDAKADPRTAGIYGAALDKVAANTPAFYLRDIANGNNPAQSAQQFLATANSNPAMAAQYAPQIKALQQTLAVTDRAKNKDWGGTVPDFAMQMFLGLDKGTLANAPTQLAMSKPEVKTSEDESGQKYTYTTQPQVLAKGAVAITDGDGNVTGYRVPVDSKAFGTNADPNINVGSANHPLYATYDAQGNRTGFESNDRVYVSDPDWYQARFDANGKPMPAQGHTSGGGFLSNAVQGISSLGLPGQLALMAATGGAGGALAAELGGGALANAAASGLVSGALSSATGGDFGKGFLGGAVGGAAGNLVNANLPTNMTGNPIVDNYLTKALPNLANTEARALVNNQNLGDAGIYSLLNTGVNMGANSLLNNVGLDKLPSTVQPYASGIASNLITSSITGKPVNLQNALMNTAYQQLIKPIVSDVKQQAKDTAKSALS